MMNHLGRYQAGLAVVLIAVPLGAANAQEIIGLGDLFGGTTYSEATGVSADGSVVVGYADTDDGYRGFRWTAAEGMRELESYSVTVETRALSVSADGEVVVGFMEEHFLGSPSSIRWQSNGQVLGYTLYNQGSHIAIDASADGSVILGNASGIGAFRWDAESKMQPLAGLSDYYSRNSGAGLSAGGSVVAGTGTIPGTTTSQATTEAFRWTAEGVVGLGTLNGAVSSQATGISADGSTIIGHSVGQAFRWTETEGLVELGGGPNQLSINLNAVSGDGGTVVGRRLIRVGEGHSFHATIWDEAGGMRSLIDELNGRGVDTSGWTRLEDASHVSADGRFIVGYGVTTVGTVEAFLVDLGEVIAGDANGDGFVGMEDLDVLLANWGETSALVAGDLSGDGVVGQADLDIVLAAWGDGAAPNATVPEPGALAMLGLSGLLLMRRRR